MKSVSSALGRKMVSAQHLDKDETGAKSNVGKCIQVCKVSVPSLQYSRVKMLGTLPFSSDYHGPKSHPPKNN